VSLLLEFNASVDAVNEQGMSGYENKKIIIMAKKYKLN
jgi:hypothetical protein